MSLPLKPAYKFLTQVAILQMVLLLMKESFWVLTDLYPLTRRRYPFFNLWGEKLNYPERIFEKMVGREGFEPSTIGLKVRCSTN